MKKTAGILLGATLMWSLLAWPIGRAGNGQKVKDSVLGFETEVSENFYGERTYDDGSFRVYRISFSSFNPEEEYLQFIPLTVQFPVLLDQTRDDAKAWNRQQGGSEFLTDNPCVDIFLYENTETVYGIAQWGVNKGIVIFAPLTDTTRVDVVKALENLKLLPGACAWK